MPKRNSRRLLPWIAGALLLIVGVTLATQASRISNWLRGAKPTDQPVGPPGAQIIPPGSPGDKGSSPTAGPNVPDPNRKPVELPTPQVMFSDSFQRPDADGSSLGVADLAYGGQGNHYYLPLNPAGSNGLPTVRLVSGVLTNSGQDFAGVQFAASPTDRGESVGQDLNIQVDLFTPTDAAGHITQAGPYFRSRAAAAGDGIGGGTSAGYWVALNSTGEVKIQRLNPLATVATSERQAAFDNQATHTLEVAAQGSVLQVSLDGWLLAFEQESKTVTTVAIPSAWENPPVGDNDGTAGIQFAAEGNRGLIGGQRATRLLVTAPRSLSGLPMQNNFERGKESEVKGF